MYLFWIARWRYWLALLVKSLGEAITDLLVSFLGQQKPIEKCDGDEVKAIEFILETMFSV